MADHEHGDLLARLDSNADGFAFRPSKLCIDAAAAIRSLQEQLEAERTRNAAWQIQWGALQRRLAEVEQEARRLNVERMRYTGTLNGNEGAASLGICPGCGLPNDHDIYKCVQNHTEHVLDMVRSPQQHGQDLPPDSSVTAGPVLAAAPLEPVRATCFHTIKTGGAYDDQGYKIAAGRYALYPADAKLYAIPPGYAVVPAEILDRFPEINTSNYDHEDACRLNDWGIEVVLAAGRVR